MWGDRRRDWGSLANYTLSHVFANKRSIDENREEHCQFSLDETWVCGYALPPFQRPVVWHEGKMIRFIEAAADGRHLGTWSYHQVDDVVKVGGRDLFPMDMWLIDGQQRLTALERFFDDGFPVYGKLWSEIDVVVKRKFLNTTVFPANVLRNRTEMELREFYDTLNFDGVAHTEDQRALARGATKDSL